MNFTRRDFGKLALGRCSRPSSLLAAKPDSKWGGVQVGINAPYSFTRMSGTADKIHRIHDSGEPECDRASLATG